MCRDSRYPPAGADTRIDYSPKAHSPIGGLQRDDQALLGHLLLVAGRVAEDLGVGDAFRLVINNGEGGGQTVFHLHLHILAGREMTEGQLTAGLN